MSLKVFVISTVPNNTNADEVGFIPGWFNIQKSIEVDISLDADSIFSEVV
jgi:hypothetical protein